MSMAMQECWCDLHKSCMACDRATGRPACIEVMQRRKAQAIVHNHLRFDEHKCILCLSVTDPGGR